MSQKKRTELATYQERTDSKTRKDVDRLMAEGARHYEAGVKDIKQGGRMLVAGCKKIWRAGRKFNEAEDINQLEFKTWHPDVEGWQQEYIRRQKVSAALKVFKACEKEPSKLEDCRAIIQPALIAAGELPEPKRLEAQVAHGRPNLWTELVSALSSVESTVENLCKQTPLEEMDKTDLQKFIKVTEPIKLKYDTAKELLEAKKE